MRAVRVARRLLRAAAVKLSIIGCALLLLAGCSSASTVDALGQACLVQTDVSIDVVLDAERDAVSVGVKAVRVNHAHLVARLVSAVRGALESL